MWLLELRSSYEILPIKRLKEVPKNIFMPKDKLTLIFLKNFYK